MATSETGLREPALRLEQAAGRLWADSPAVKRWLVAELGIGATPEQSCRYLAALGDEGWDQARLARTWDTIFRDGAGDRSGHDALKPEVAARSLRVLRRRLMLGLAVRDVAGLAALDEVTGAMTRMAEFAVVVAVRAQAAALAADFGVPVDRQGQPQDLLVVAMGKAGTDELNVSSDLDLIYVYDRDGDTAAAPAATGGRFRQLSNQEFFSRLGIAVAAMLSDQTADGFVFRIDLRLRPNGDSGLIAVSVPMLEEYLLRQGREWERFAWLKSRVISGPVFATAADFSVQRASLEQCVSPFVFRRYLDFSALGSLRDLHRKIRGASDQREADRSRAGMASRGYNVKLGRGGIREIEFIAQTFQIIRGGRDPRLRLGGTCRILAQLAVLGALTDEAAVTLTQAYVFLRRLEHALQYVDDAQTHWLPEDARALAVVAGFLGLASPTELVSRYQDVSAAVAMQFDRIFEHHGWDAVDQAPPPELPGDPERLSDYCLALGFEQPEQAAGRLLGLIKSRRIALLSQSARQRFDHLLTRTLRVISAQEWRLGERVLTSRDEVLSRWVALVEVIATRSTYLALLDEHPAALERVLRVLAAGPFPSDYLCRHPIVLDELLDPRLDLQQPAWADWSAELEAALLHADDDPERQMNLLRDAHHAQVFRLLVADLAARMDVEALAAQLSHLADLTVAQALACAWSHLSGRHRDAPAFVVVAYGKLGARELGYASDLDLIFVYDDPDPAAAEVYSRLVRRLMNWLTLYTSSGVLFDVDLRLRPNGNAGLLVSPYEAYARYQRNEDGLGAWTWEHQALIRARVCCGDAALASRIESLRHQILVQPRDPVALRDDVIAMRARMAAGHPNPGPLMDLKHDPGGLVDLEFAVQWLVLRWAYDHPELTHHRTTTMLLQSIVDAGCADADLAGAAIVAYRRLRTLQHRLRLAGAKHAQVPAAQVAQETAAIKNFCVHVLGAS